EIKTLLINAHHLLNSFRVHQAREEIIAHVQAQLTAKQQMLDELDAACAAASWEAVESGSPDAPSSPVPEVGVSQPAEADANAPAQSSSRLEILLRTMDQLGNGAA
ncbi:MAG: hypothetical protein SGPRY_012207, partial [Prymnesium sp.]